MNPRKISVGKRAESSRRIAKHYKDEGQKERKVPFVNRDRSLQVGRRAAADEIRVRIELGFFVLSMTPPSLPEGALHAARKVPMGPVATALITHRPSDRSLGPCAAVCALVQTKPPI